MAAEIAAYPAAAGPVSGWCVPIVTVSAVTPGVASSSGSVQATRAMDAVAASAAIAEIVVGERMTMTSDVFATDESLTGE